MEKRNKILIGTIIAAFIVVISLFHGGSEVLRYEVGECSAPLKLEKSVEYDEKNRILTAFVEVNCCGVNVTVEKENDVYRIIEKQYGELCKCMCVKKVKIYDVPTGARVEFVNKDGLIKILKGFCGWSTYGECKSDEDCIVDGCSGQVCRSKFENPIVTTCEWLDCYDAKGVACRCVNGKCQWTLG